MHPNWKALTTINFAYKKFVKASDPNDENALTNEIEPCQQKQSGEEIQKFYEDVIKESVIKKEKIAGLFGQCEKIFTRIKFISPVFFSHELISMSGINIFLV